MAEVPQDWRTQNFRQKVVTQIEEAIRQAASPMSRSSMEMESQVFQKAKSREEYLALVARLILHVKDFNAKKDKKAQQQGPAGLAGHPLAGQGNPQAMPGQHQGAPDPINALQTLARQGSANMAGQPQPPQQPQAGMMGGHQQQIMQPRLHQQRIQLPQQQVQQPQQMGQQQRPILQRQDAFIVTSPQNVTSVQTQPLPASATGQFQPQGGIVPRQGQMAGAQQQYQVMQGQQVPTPQAPAHSPAPINSPVAMLPTPSPQAMVTPSPVSRGQAGAPSPGTANLNTPGNPGSVGGAPSPGAPRTTAEEQIYLEKLNKLSKYVEPLRRMVNKLEKEEERKKDYTKMKSLLDILTNSNKRVPMATLQRCEQVLENWDIPIKATSSSTHTSSTTHMCQPLLDAVAHHIKSPTINHTLHRTFGPAVSALNGPRIRGPDPPSAKRKREDEDEQGGVPDILQGEIARLDSRFKVNLDLLHHPNSTSVHLLCRLDDRNLPSVPPITVTVPDQYPENCPEADSVTTEGYDACPFFEEVQENFNSSLLSMPNRFSLTSMLETWEMSVRRALRPVKC